MVTAIEKQLVNILTDYLYSGNQRSKKRKSTHKKIQRGGLINLRHIYIQRYLARTIVDNAIYGTPTYQYVSVYFRYFNPTTSAYQNFVVRDRAVRFQNGEPFQNNNDIILAILKGSLQTPIWLYPQDAQSTVSTSNLHSFPRISFDAFYNATH